MTFKERYTYNPQTGLLGKGAFAEVFKAQDQLLERPVALKFYIGGFKKKYDVLTEIRKVIKQGLNHPNLIGYYDATLVKHTDGHGRTEKKQIGILEYANGKEILKAGGDLKAYIKTLNLKQTADLQQFKAVLIGILKGLGYLHQKNMLHRDLKPANILMHRAENGIWIPKIGDFGLSKQVDNDESSSYGLKGTIEYMAPEQIFPRKYGQGNKIHTNADLWAVGAMIYEAFVGTVPFGRRSEGSTIQEIMENVDLFEETQLITDVIPSPFKEVMQHCLVKKAADRVQNADELIGILEGKKAPQPKPDYKDETITINEVPAIDKTEKRDKKVFEGGETAPQKDLTWLYGLVALMLMSLSVLGAWFTQETTNQAPKGMIFVKGGSFMMGCLEGDSDCDDDEKPRHEVVLDDFYIGKYEVTNLEYCAFLNAKGNQEEGGVTWLDIESSYCLIEYKNSRYTPKSGYGKHPVIEVTWYGARAYAKWKGMRLPTEAEWEYAARSRGKNQKWAGTSNESSLHLYGNYDDSGEKDGYERTAPVGRFSPNALGIYDMSGNVWEWCSDWYYKNYYKKSPKLNSENTYEKNNSSLRGGSWDSKPRDCRTSYRNDINPSYTNSDTGFRLAQ